MINPKKQILAVILIFIVGVCCKLHFSSIGMWDHYVKGTVAKPAGLIFGEPRSIRSDEWLVGTAWMMAQANSNPPLPTENRSIGAGSSALLVGMPARHWSSFFRPFNWGFHFLPMEYALSWQWMMMSVGLLSVLYLLCLRLTNGAQLLALSGCLWIYFSAFTQWWFASVASLLLSFSAACISFSYLWTAQTRGTLLISSLAFCYWALAFGLILYPPFQIVLAFLGVVLLPLLADYKGVNSTISWKGRVAALFLAVLVPAVLLLLFVRENSALVAIMSKTVYPGTRVMLGGTFDFARYFSGFFTAAFSENTFPRIYGNVCEASAFILLWPVVAVIMIRRDGWRRVASAVPLLIYLVWVSNWIVFGTSETVAKITLWSYVPASRAVLGVGLGSVLFVISVLARRERAGLRLVEWLVLSGSVVALYLATVHFEGISGGSPKLLSLGLAAAGSFLLVCAILSGNRLAISASVVIAVVIPNCRVNPLMRGFESVTGTPFYKAIREVDPERTAVWAVFDTNVGPQLAKTAGVRVLNGNQYAPDLGMYRLFDRSGRYRDVYNRYANIAFEPLAEGSKLEFKLLQPDAWILAVDPCHPAFTKLKVEYIAFYSHRQNLNYSCLELVKDDPSFLIFKRKGKSEDSSPTD